MPLDQKKLDIFNKGLERTKKMSPTPKAQPTSGAATPAPEHDEFSSDKDSEHKKYMKSDKPSDY